MVCERRTTFVYLCSFLELLSFPTADNQPPIKNPDGNHCIEGFTNTTLYRGCQRFTRSGLECQRWDGQSPHVHKYTSHNYGSEYGIGAHNYCRNPPRTDNINLALWCFTTDPQNRWEFCDPFCSSDTPDGIICECQDGSKCAASQCKYNADIGHTKCPDMNLQATYMGCYEDDEERDLKLMPRGKGHTVESCQALCMGYSVFALQNKGECTCDNHYSTKPEKYNMRPRNECGGPCPGEKFNRNINTLRCGGLSRNAIYSFLNPSCGCEIDSIKFCNFNHDPGPAFCERCSNYHDESACTTNNLNKKAVADCIKRCFGANTGNERLYLYIGMIVIGIVAIITIVLLLFSVKSPKTENEHMKYNLRARNEFFEKQDEEVKQQGKVELMDERIRGVKKINPQSEDVGYWSTSTFVPKQESDASITKEVDIESGHVSSVRGPNSVAGNAGGAGPVVLVWETETRWPQHRAAWEKIKSWPPGRTGRAGVPTPSNTRHPYNIFTNTNATGARARAGAAAVTGARAGAALVACDGRDEKNNSIAAAASAAAVAAAHDKILERQGLHLEPPHNGFFTRSMSLPELDTNSTVTCPVTVTPVPAPVPSRSRPTSSSRPSWLSAPAELSEAVQPPVRAFMFEKGNQGSLEFYDDSTSSLIGIATSDLEAAEAQSRRLDRKGRGMTNIPMCFTTMPSIPEVNEDEIESSEVDESRTTKSVYESDHSISTPVNETLL